MKKNVFIFALDNRSFVETKNVVKEISKNSDKFNYFYLYSDNVVFDGDLSSFNYDSNIEYKQSFKLNSLNIYLPFKPDVFITSRDAWEPDVSIYSELKQSGCIVCNVENSCWVYNNIKTRLEILSRMQFPKNLIDIHFDHSEHSKQNKLQAGYVNYKNIVVGNPKYDDISLTNRFSNNNKIIVYGSTEESLRNHILSKLSILNEKLSKTHEIYYRPHPSELKKFSFDFTSTSLKNFENVKLIVKETDLVQKIEECDTHISIVSSVLYYPLLMNKKVVYINYTKLFDSEIDLNVFKNTEDFTFWSNFFRTKSFEEFCNLVDITKTDKFKHNIIQLFDKIKLTLLEFDDNLNWLNVDFNEEYLTKQQEILRIFDEYHDGNASKRIVNVLDKIYE